MQLSALTFEEATHDESFRRLFRLLHRDALTWNTFLSLPMPNGMSTLDAWKFFNELSECFGISLISNINEGKLWYRPTYRLMEASHAIKERCLVHAPHHQALITDPDQSMVLELRVEEACAAVALAGLIDDCEQHVSQCLTDPSEISVVDRLVNNMIRIGSNLGNYFSMPFSEQLFEMWQEELRVDITDEEFFDLLAYSLEHPAEVSPYPTMQANLERVIEYANHEQGEPEDSPLHRGILLGDLLVYYRPFEFMSPLIASLATRLYYLKYDLSVLSLIPLSKQKLEWRGNKPLLERLPYSFNDYESTFRHCLGDLTFHQILNLHLIDNGLNAVEVKRGTRNEKDALMRELLSLETDINYRQRSILARALRNPKANFRISYHQRKHNVAYATARRDLMELKDKGYFRVEHQGREFVFYPDEKLDQFVF